MNYNKLKQRPKHFQSFTGLTVEEFNELVNQIRGDWKHQRIERLINNNPNRQRKLGGGRKHIIAKLEDQLLLTLIWSKFYLSYLLLEYMFGPDESTIWRAIQPIILLMQGKFILPPRRQGRKITTIEELKEIIPELDEILADATEQKIPRPRKKQKRKKYHSGKKKAFTIKKQIATSAQGLIIHSARASPGRKHDYKLFKESGLPEIIPKDLPAYADNGYQGANKDYPDLNIILPHKRTRNHRELTRSEKIQNTKQRRKRVKVEHTLSQLKKFKLLSDVYRNSLQNYDLYFDFVANIVNFRMLCRLNSG